jgi:hypothetical protein
MTFTKEYHAARRAAALAASQLAPEQQAQIGATSAGSDKERVTELNAKVATYQSKTAADLQEARNMADIVLTSQNEVNAISGLRRPDGAGTGGLQQPKVAR